MELIDQLRRFAENEIGEGRDSIDVISDLQAKGLSPREAEAMVEDIIASANESP
jgi:hypothetical protein